MLLVLLVSEGDVIEDRDDRHSSNGWKRFVVCGVIAAMTNIFIPTTKELLYIYGIGGTIDYQDQRYGKERFGQVYQGA